MKKSPTKNKPSRLKIKAVNGTGTDWIENHAVDPGEVRLFCTRHGLFQEGDWAVAMAKRDLHPRKLRVVIEGDPEGSSEWLVLDVDIQGPVDEVLAAYHQFKDKWLAHVSPAKRNLMRLVTNIL